MKDLPVIRAIFAAALLLLLAGCASQEAHRRGVELINQGQIELGLAELEQAVKDAPDVVRYRTELARQRDLAVGQLLAQADAARANNDVEQAEAVYARVSRIDPTNLRARAGVDALRADRRHGAAVIEAEGLLAKGELDRAQSRVQAVLAESPNHVGARALQRRLAEARLKQVPAAKGLRPNFQKPVTLELRDAAVRSVFEVLSRSTGINFVFDKYVRPDLRVTIFVKDKSLEDTLKILLLTNQLEQKIVDGNTIIIYPNTAGKAREYLDLSVKAFHLTNADPAQMVNTIRSLLRTRDIIFDEKLNIVVMRDTPEAIRAAEKLVALHDQAEPEVILQLEVMEVATSRLMELGLRFPEQVSASIIGGGGTPGTITLPELQNFNSGMVRLNFGDPAVLLNLRKTDSDVNLLANPRVRVRNREKARVHVGEKVPVITTTLTATGVSSGSVSYLDVGLKLEIESNIYLDDEVAMRVGLEVSNILETVIANNTTSYRLGTRNAATTLRLKDGETQILAGLIQNDDRRTSNKLPGLGDFPIIGRLFQSNLTNNVKTEIVLLITPRVVRNVVRPEATMSEFTTGTDASLGAGGSGTSLTPGFGPPPAPARAAAPPAPAGTPSFAPPGAPPPGTPATAAPPSTAPAVSAPPPAPAPFR